MIDNLFGDMEEKQKVIKNELASIMIEENLDGVRLVVSADNQVRNINIDPSLLEDKEQLEDLLVVSINNALKKVAEKEAEISQKLFREMMPPGFEDLFG